MGWKAIKDHYRISHIVCVTEGGICIGSPYIHNIIVIRDGEIAKRYEAFLSQNLDLNRYQSEMDADPETLRRLALQPDTFERSLPVYTYNIYSGGEILEKQCEEFGWPNVTHDGQIQYNNTFSADRAQVVKWALEDGRCHVRSLREHVSEARENLREKRARLQAAKDALAKLKAAEGLK